MAYPGILNKLLITANAQSTLRVCESIIRVGWTVINAFSRGVVGVHIVGNGANRHTRPSNVFREIVGLSRTGLHAQVG